MHSLFSEKSTSTAIHLSFGLYKPDILRNSERRLVSSLIRQFLTRRPESYRRVKEFLELLALKPNATLPQLWTLFHYLLTIPSETPIFLVINAIDHCEQPVADKIISLAADASMRAPLKLVFTCSTVPRLLDEKIMCAHTIRLDCHDWEEAISSISKQRVSRLVDSRPVWKQYESSIVEKLCERDYSFLYIMLTLDVLAQSKIPSTKAALEQLLMRPLLPMSAVFDTIVSGLESSDTARRALNWIYHAVRPLTVPELSVALALGSSDEEAGTLTLEAIAQTVSWDLMRDLGDALGATVKVVDDRVLLVHHTFREYLRTKNSLLLPDFHALIASKSVAYISLCVRQSAADGTSDASHFSDAAALRNYAELYWVDHYKLHQPPSRSLDELVESFLKGGTDDQGLALWKSSFWQANSWGEAPTDEPLSIAAQLGLDRVVHRLLSDTTASDPDEIRNALVIAARMGSTTLLRSLLEVVRPGSLEPALRAATEFGQCDAIDIILPRIDNASVELLKSDQGPDSLVLLAASKGHCSAVETLLSGGFSLQASTAEGNTPVHIAAYHGGADILATIERLRPNEFKAAMDALNIDKQTPLELSCIVGFTKAFDIVSQNTLSSQPGVENKVMACALQRAVSSGHISLVERLVARGACLTDEVGKAVRTAAQNGFYDVVQYFVSNESSAAENDQVASILEAAVAEGQVRVAELLLSKTKLDDSAQQNLLWEAVDGGHANALKALVASGIPVGGQDDYDPLIDTAIRENFVDIVAFLVKQGMRPQWDGTETSLHYAAKLNYGLCIREMISNTSKDDIRRRDFSGDTALDVAAQSAHLDSFRALLSWEDSQIGQDTQQRATKIMIAAIESPNGELNTAFVEFLLDSKWPADPPAANEDSPLQAAIEKPDYEIAKLLLERGANPNRRGKTNSTPLLYAVAVGNVELVTLLLEHGANPNTPGADGLTPLHKALTDCAEVARAIIVPEGSLPGASGKRVKLDVEIEAPGGWRAIHFAAKSAELTASLLELDPPPDVNAVLTGSRATALMLACSAGESEAVAWLLKAKADTTLLDSDGLTALHYAASGDKDAPDIARVLVNSGIPSNARASDQSTPLYCAIRKGNHDTAVYLLHDAAAHPKLYGGTMHSPLQAAAFVGDRDLAVELLDANADPNAQGGSLGSPLNAAAYKGHHELAELLLDRGADVNLSAPPFGTPLQARFMEWFSTEDEDGGIKFIALLIARGAELKPRQWAGYRPPLHLLIWQERVAEVQKLLDHGAATDDVDSVGESPLHIADEEASTNLVQLLLDHGAQPTARDNIGRSVLYQAALNNHPSTFAALIKAVPLSKQQRELEEVLPAAAKSGSTEILDTILGHESEAGPLNLDVPDRSGWTALDIAECCGRSNLAEKLRARGARHGLRKDRPTVLSAGDRDCDIVLPDDGTVATGQSLGIDVAFMPTTAAVRADHPFPADGSSSFYFEVEVVEASGWMYVAKHKLKLPPLSSSPFLAHCQ